MKFTFFILLWLSAFIVSAQTPAKPAASTQPLVYGTSISLEHAKKILAAAESFATSKQYTVAIAIVDTGGNLVAFEKMNNTQIGSIDIAMGKAKTANNFKRPTKALEDALASGGVGLRLLAVPAYPIEGGEPIFDADGKIIGAIGASGMTAVQDGEVVKAALAADLK